jgi:hypothetical protein
VSAATPPAETTDTTAADETRRSDVPALARRLAAHLGSLTSGGRAVVVLVDPRTGATHGHVADGADAPLGAEQLATLVCSSEPAVVPTARVHDLAVRALGLHWGTDAVLVAPCLFGNDVVALVALPLPPGTTVAAPSLVRAVRSLTERFAASVVRARLFAAVGLAA